MDQPGAPSPADFGESAPSSQPDPAKQKNAQPATAQHQQQQQLVQQQLAARNQQARQQFIAQKKQVEQQRIQATIQLKDQAKKIGTYDASSAVLSTTTGGDLSEQTVVRTAMEAAQLRRQREEKARQKMAKPGQIGRVPKTTKQDDQDALQRQSEQALGE